MGLFGKNSFNLFMTLALFQIHLSLLDRFLNLGRVYSFCAAGDWVAAHGSPG